MKPKPLIKGIAIFAERERALVRLPSGGLKHQHALSFQNILENVVALDTVLFHAFSVLTAKSVSIVYRINMFNARIPHPKSSRFHLDSADRYAPFVNAEVIQNCVSPTCSG